MQPSMLGAFVCLVGTTAACSGGGGGGGGGSSSAIRTPPPAPGSGSAAAPAAAPASPAGSGSAELPQPLAGDPPWLLPAGWRTEVIPFPLDFAPTIAHRGAEVLRFPPGFLDPTSGNYWSYAFLWRTEDPAQLDAAALGAELTAYFRGLIDAVDEQKRVQARDEIVARAAPAGAGRFQVTAHVFDAFKTAAPLDLTGTAERRRCRAGALWVFVLAPSTSAIRPRLEELARAASCAR
ncbi:MAG TPA: hypothetical protein VN253_04930 [Kofleriaceae bacterium]|nr:hypothetical protein [Kofleriaceae bacterium]